MMNHADIPAHAFHWEHDTIVLDDHSAVACENPFGVLPVTVLPTVPEDAPRRTQVRCRHCGQFVSAGTVGSHLEACRPEVARAIDEEFADIPFAA